MSSEVARQRADFARLGAGIGAFMVAMSEFGRAFNAGIGIGAKAMQTAIDRERMLQRARALGDLTPEQRDEISRRRYDDAVKRQRMIGLVGVRRDVDRVRRELGLS